MNSKSDNQSVKQWLYSVRTMERRRRAIINEVGDLKAERDTVYDTATAFYGGERVQSNTVAQPTLNKAIALCDRMDARLDKLLSELELLTLKSDAVRDELNAIFERGDMKVEEYEALLYYYFEGMSNEEVAEAMFYSVDYVSELKSKAIRRLGGKAII